MSSATRDVPIDQLRGLPLKKRLQIMEALLESIESERGPEPVSGDPANEPDRRDEEEDEADIPSSASWQEVRTEIRTVFIHYHRCP
jgi:hypothetical protein